MRSRAIGVLAAAALVLTAVTVWWVGTASSSGTPTVSVPKAVIDVVEGDSGTTAVPVTVTLAPASSQTVTVAYATADGTAKSGGADYVPAAGSLTFLPGETSHGITLQVRGDTTLEGYETFSVRLSSPTNATLANAVEKVRILNDEMPKLTLGSVKVAEGSPAVFKPRLSQPYYRPITLTERTSDGSATAPADYAAVDRTVVIPAGTRAVPRVSVTTVADGLTEPTETFSLAVTGPDVVAGGATRTGTILGDLCRNATPPATYQHVVVVVMENHRYADVVGNAAAPWFTRVAKGCATATKYAQAASPSRPNYLALTGGSVFDCAGSNADPAAGTCNPSSESVFKQVIDAGGTAISYAEGMNGNCDPTSHGSYAVKHNPWPYFAGESTLCRQYDQPLPTALDVAHLPTLLAIFPDLCHDMHDCSVASGDAWLQQYLQPLLDSPAYRDGSTALVVTFDEYTNIPNLVASASVKPGVTVKTATSHFAFLRTVEDMLGLPPLGQAASATGLRTATHL